MKKLIALLLAAMLACSPLFTGCTTDQQDPSGGSGTTSEEQQDTDSTHEDEEHGDGQDHDADTPKISRNEAVQIVLGRVDGAKESDIRELDTDHDDGQLVYEGELRYGGYEYEFEIDGETGEIIQWKIDRE
ncbi:MAG: PepSY domain-containing protein [Anaerovoracaceae bacterium]|nr:PepSY domain-containing protein [Anaerovoracaceae bacterium]